MNPAAHRKYDQRIRGLRLQLAALDTAYTIQDMDIPGFKLHPLKGKLTEGTLGHPGEWQLAFDL